MTRGHLLIRADGDARIGAGHLIRCLSLARGWVSSGGAATLATATPAEHIRRRATRTGVHLELLPAAHPDPSDLAAFADLAVRLRPVWTILDGYHLDSSYQLAVRKLETRVMVIDDLAHLSEYHADAILNQNINAENLEYSVPEDTRMLLGTKYALLDHRFADLASTPPAVSPHSAHVLVTLGGADPHNQTLKVVRALLRLPQPDLRVTVVAGPANPHLDALARALRGRDRFHLLNGTDEMPSLMAQSDAAVCAGGSTCWELACIGVPACILVIAENQTGIAEGLDAAGVARNLGWSETVTEQQIENAVGAVLQDPSQRQRMSRLGRRLVDGRGVERVVAEIDALTHAPRPA